MPDKNASINNGPQEPSLFKIDRRKLATRSIAAISICVFCLGMVYVFVRLRMMTPLLQEIIGIHTELKEMRQLQDANAKELTWRVDYLEKVLYGEFGDAVEKMRKSGAMPKAGQVELWQKTRDAELRERIKRLEMWRMQMEAVR